jgi:cysteine sulfinate desulfinase/cysteine desulfurase-like protein
MRLIGLGMLLRLSLSENNTKAVIEDILEKLPAVISRLREMSPQWPDLACGS